MPHRVSLLCLAALLLVPPAAAGVAEFLAACSVEGADLARLSERLATADWTEQNPADGPSGPAMAQGAAQ